MTNLNDALMRSTLMSERIRQRTDAGLRDLAASMRAPSFMPLEDLMISERAWNHVNDSGIAPKLVFAHPDILRRAPRMSLYYRGIALLPLKRVANIAAPVAAWEDGTRKSPISDAHAKSVARLYNAAISSIIEGASNWTLENGYRNIIANMGIGLDGTFRNIIGRDAEELIKTRIASWLRTSGLDWRLKKTKMERSSFFATDTRCVSGRSRTYSFSGADEADGRATRRQSKSKAAKTPPARLSVSERCKRVSTRPRPIASTC